MDRLGLSTAEAAHRLERDGPNEPRSRARQPGIVRALRMFANPLVVILLIAAIASGFLGEPVNAILIGAIVLASVAINAWQTIRSEHAVRQLQHQIAPTASVQRDGTWVEIPRRALVEGDVIRLAAGDLVPADARLVEAVDLHVQQAALTGESMPAEKAVTGAPAAGTESPDLVFLGTSVVSGTATAVVLATGSRTAFGDVVERLAARPGETEFERGMRHFGMLILKTVTFLVLFILVVNVSLGRDAFQSVLFSVALAVGLTPEFLPMITTVTLARGAVEMAREKVIVKHLQSIQNLGSIDILCSDKTGTLTAGTMSVDASLDIAGRASDRPLELAQINSAFESGIASPLDAAILERRPEPPADVTKINELPFDFDRRRLSVVVARRGETLLITKGAPESVLACCTCYEHEHGTAALDDAARARYLATFRAQSAGGFRVLAVAYRHVDHAADGERELTLVGFVTFADHMLADVPDTLAQLRRDGVTVKILTGDNELITEHICREVGIADPQIVLGEQLDRMTEDALARVAEYTQVFARVSPAQKHRIIRALAQHGHVVGFLGDGINDAPSLHAADVGISVAGAAAVAREAADIILLERRLAVLHAGILAGRRSFGNALKYLLMGTSSNFGNVLSMAVASAFLPFLPMLPTQILVNNFLYDAAQLAIPTDRVDPGYVDKPQRWNIRLIRDFMLVIGPISSLFDFLTFYVLLVVLGLGERLFQTGWFVESLATQTLVLFVIRTVGPAWKHRPSTPLAITTLLVVAIAVALPWSPIARALGFAPLPGAFFAFLVVVIVAYLAVVEVVKRRLVSRRFERARGHALRLVEATA